MRQEPLFAVYGLCVQAIVEGGMKYFSVCRWFGKNIVPMKNYVLLWLPVAVLRVVVERFGWQYSFVALIIGVFLLFIWNFWFAMQDPMIKTAVMERLKSFRSK